MLPVFLMELIEILATAPMQPIVILSEAPEQRALYVSGLDTIVNSTSKIELGVNSAGSVGSGTYTDTSFNKAYFNYLDSPGQTWSVNSSNGPSFTIVLTGVSANNVQGTFSGTIKDQQGFGTDSIVVSNGLFNVPVK